MDRRASGLRRGDNLAAHIETFEESYPRYEFAELVRLALAAGAWLVGVRRRFGARPDASSPPLTGEATPAE